MGMLRAKEMVLYDETAGEKRTALARCASNFHIAIRWVACGGKTLANNNKNRRAELR